jgi:hypothetical protein
VQDDDQRTAAPPTASPDARDGGPTGPTGDAAVDEALTRLADLDDLPVRQHVAVFDAVHAALQDRLADVED